MKTQKVTIQTEPGKQDILITREFDAPPELVFRAHTDPRLFARWFGCSQVSTSVDRMDAKTGGSYQFTQTDLDGGKHEFRGVYHEVAASEKLVKTFEYEGNRGHVILETTRFEALPGGRTRLVAHQVFQSVADRDAMIEVGVERGTSETFARLDELLKGLQ